MSSYKAIISALSAFTYFNIPKYHSNVAPNNAVS